MTSSTSIIRNFILLAIIVFAPQTASATSGGTHCDVWSSQPDEETHWVCRDCVYWDCWYTCYQFNCAIEGTMYGDESPDCWLDRKACGTILIWSGPQSHPFNNGVANAVGTATGEEAALP